MGGVLEAGEPVIRTPDHRLRVFVSSTLGELAEERAALRRAVERLHLVPVMFELGARPHPPRQLYRAYLAQSHVFVGVYWQRYGWVAPGEAVSGLEDEYRLADGLPMLLYVKDPAPDREPRLQELLDRITADDRASYRRFTTPSELARLVEQDLAVLLTERFEMAARPAPAASSHARPRPAASAPPVPLTPTVGRDREVAELVDLLTARRTRLVTLTGPGGVGKSRLSLEVARRIAADAPDAFPDGIHHVPLEAVSDPRDVMRVVADRLGAGGEALRSVGDVLEEHLEGRTLLLVVDNAEHVVDAAVDLGAVLDCCSTVQALVTSRQPLRLRGELEYPVAPLAVPDADDAPTATDGVELFLQRARAVRPDFALTASTLPAVAELVRRLDGLPLAIELAAARTRLLPPEVVLDRLEERLDLLGSGAVDLPERQRTLRATIDWSFRLLEPEEQRLLGRLGVFAGDPDLAAVEAVCAEPGVDVAEVLASLLEKSLLVSAATTGEPRVHLLWTVRAYARERLAEAGDADVLADRHADWFRQRARLLAPIGDPAAHGRFDPMLVETVDIRAAMDHVLAAGDTHRTSDLAGSTCMWFWLTGRAGDVRDWFERATTLVDDDRAAPFDRGRLAFACGQMIQLYGAHDRAAALLSAALPLLDRDGAGTWVGACRVALSAALPHLGRHEEGDEQARAALAIGEDLDEPHLVGYACAMLGTSQVQAGDLVAARASFERMLAQARRVGFGLLEAQARSQLGLVAALEGQRAEAWRHLAAARDVLHGTGSLEMLSYWCEFAARPVLDAGDAETALQLLLAATALRRSIGLGDWARWVPTHDAWVAEASAALDPAAIARAGTVGVGDAWGFMDQVLAAHAPR